MDFGKASSSNNGYDLILHIKTAQLMKNYPKIHPTSDVQSLNIGEGTSVWQYTIILPKATIGDECNIGCQCFIENNVSIGNRVTIKNGCQLFDSLRICDDVFIGPNVTFTNDLYPRSRRGSNREKNEYPTTTIESGASIGGGSVILPGITIGAGSMIGAGSVVTNDVPPNTVIKGVKATITKKI